jgi:LPPG:FO 2-phospho-L-lactate transferase
MIVALAGGVGGAKLAQGLALAGPTGELTVIVNTADDFDLYGLRICPDLDTVLYTLAGIANPATGWGIEGDTHALLGAIAGYGRDPWFQLGDRDFATHILRTERLRQGATLTEVTAELTTATKVRTPDGVLDFQDYFVARRQQDDVIGIEFEGAAYAGASGFALQAIAAAEVIVLCPSNPLVSVGPILAVPGYLKALVETPAPVVAVSPIVGGQALKGPAGKMLATLGHEVSAVGVANLYRDFLDGMVIDIIDADLAPRIESLGIRVLIAQTVMGDAADRARLAAEVIAFGRSLARTGAAV